MTPHPRGVDDFALRCATNTLATRHLAPPLPTHLYVGQGTQKIVPNMFTVLGKSGEGSVLQLRLCRSAVDSRVSDGKVVQCTVLVGGPGVVGANHRQADWTA